MANGNNHSNKAVRGKVKYNSLSRGQFSEELIVTLLTSNKGLITAIFSESFIDKKNKSVDAFIIDEKGDSFLVELPNYSFTSGSKVWFPKKNVALEGSLV
jgi:hypothetical protein